MADFLRKNIRRSALALAVASTVMMVGCQAPKGGHQKAVSNANARWHTLRSTSMLRLAQQQFDAGDLTQAEKTLVEAMSVDISNPALHVLSGRIAIEQGQLERAYERFRTALDIDDKQIGAHYYQGVVFQRWQQFDKALVAYGKAYEIQSDNVSFLLAMSEMHVAMGNRDTAVKLLESKVVYFDQNASIRSALGQLYYLDRNFTQAVHYLKQASYLAPDNLQLLENLASAQRAAGQSAEAVRNLERLVNDPENRDRVGLKRMLAAAYERADRLQEARQIYIDLNRQDPRDADAWFKLASLSLVNNDTAAALAAAERVMALDGSRAEGYIIAAMVWQKRGRFDQAIRLFERAASLAPQSAEPMILRGIAQEHAGQRNAAASSYSEALRRSPSDERAKNLLDRLSRVDQVN